MIITLCRQVEQMAWRQGRSRDECESGDLWENSSNWLLGQFWFFGTEEKKIWQKGFWGQNNVKPAARAEGGGRWWRRSWKSSWHSGTALFTNWQNLVPSLVFSPHRSKLNAKIDVRRRKHYIIWMPKVHKLIHFMPNSVSLNFFL